jgi:hypothetical protein
MLDASSQRSAPAPDRVVRSFWHGPFSAYEALCLSSFVAAGVEVELFGDEPLSVPRGVRWRNAREILDRDVAFYRHEFDGPSPSLHANHFRYALLETLGGWWIDTDVMFVGNELPATEVFLARQSDEELNGAVMRFPAGHSIMRAARERTASVLDVAQWGDTGPKLVTELLTANAPDIAFAPRESTYAIGPDEFQKFLLPAACDEITARTANSTFVHLWNEMWRKAGIPKTIAPPRGCWLDRMFERYEVPVVWSDRLDAAFVERWAALRRDRDHAGYYNLVHSQELTRLRREIGILKDSLPSGIGRLLGKLKARLRSE